MPHGACDDVQFAQVASPVAMHYWYGDHDKMACIEYRNLQMAYEALDLSLFPGNPGHTPNSLPMWIGVYCGRSADWWRGEGGRFWGPRPAADALHVGQSKNDILPEERHLL